MMVFYDCNEGEQLNYVQETLIPALEAHNIHKIYICGNKSDLDGIMQSEIESMYYCWTMSLKNNNAQEQVNEILNTLFEELFPWSFSR